MQTEISLYLAVIVLFTNTEVSSIHLRELIVPKYPLKGRKVSLKCLYDLEDGDTLYAVKWYKENEEFYRYVPKSSPRQVSYKVDGIKVDVEESNNQTVVLRDVDVSTSGLYRCEVSAEAPSFSSAQKEGRLEILALPLNGPQISGERKQYQIGDELNLNCSSDRSNPVTILTWYINETPAPSSMLKRYPNTNYLGGLKSSTLGLKMSLFSDHFVDGSLRVRCLATLPSKVWKGDKESIVQKSDNREAMLLVRSVGSRSTSPKQFFICYIILVLLTTSHI